MEFYVMDEGTRYEVTSDGEWYYLLGENGFQTTYRKDTDPVNWINTVPHFYEES